MSANNSNNSAPACPFFCGTEPNGIICEGTSQYNTIHLRFQYQAKKQIHYEHFCCSMQNYERCYISMMLLKFKYEE